MKKICLHLAVVFCLFGMTPGLAQEASLSGYWESTYGRIAFMPDGAGYSGVYTQDDGRIELKYQSEGTYAGFWAEGSSSQKCSTQKLGSYHWGRLLLPVSRERGPMVMKWGYCDGDLTQSWNIQPTDEQPDLVSGLYGNWKATWHGSDTPPSFVSVKPSNDKNSGASANIFVDGWHPRVTSLKFHSDQATISANGKIEIKWSYGHLGYWNGYSELRVQSADRIVGKWEYKGKGGNEVWERSQPRITHTQAQHGDIPSDMWLSDAGSWLVGPIRPLGQMVTLKTEYLDERANARGNRDTVFLNIYGEDLWGVHDLKIPQESGLTIDGFQYLCHRGENAKYQAHWGDQVCLSQGGVIGVRIPMGVWAHAAPGVKTLTFDGQRVPFKLEVKNFPNAEEESDLVTEIYSTVLLDDQFGQRRSGARRSGNYAYPFTRDGTPTQGQATRLLVVTGKNLRLDGQTYFMSRDGRVSYEVLTVPANVLRDLHAAGHRLGNSRPRTGEEVLAVKATLRPGVQPGVKGFMLNGAAGQWGLAFENQFGTIRFLHAGSTPRDPAERRFYAGETIRVGIRALSNDLPIEGARLLLEAVGPITSEGRPSRRRTLGIVSLDQTDDLAAGHNMAVSQPLLPLYRSQRRTIRPRAGEIPLILTQGDKIVATLVDGLSLAAIPPGAIAEILARPARPELWQSALNRVAQCQGVGGNPQADGFEAQTSARIERLLITEGFNTRRATITKGDHAALILIRDRLLPMVRRENDKLKAYIEGSNPERLAMRYHSEAKANPNGRNNAFWTLRTAAFPNPDHIVTDQYQEPATITVPLADTLDIDAFAARLKLKKVATRDLVNKAVAAALKAQYEATRASVRRGRAAGDCSLEELLVIAGQRAERAVADILPDLMARNNGRWEPDHTARKYVRSVYLLGAEVSALEAYASIDDAYKSMAIALVAAPVAAGGSWLAAYSGSAWAANVAAGAGYAALAADAIDMAYFGAKGIGDYMAGEEDFTTAMGLSPVIGPEAAKEAQARRQSAVLAAVGVIAPAIGGAATLRSLRELKNINKGRTLLRGKDGLKSLDELSDTERADLAAYYTYLKETDGSRLSRLLKGEKDDMARLDEMVRQAGGVPADSAVAGAAKAADEADGTFNLPNAKSGDSAPVEFNDTPSSVKGGEGTGTFDLPSASDSSKIPLSEKLGDDVPSGYFDETGTFRPFEADVDEPGSKTMPWKGSEEEGSKTAQWPAPDAEGSKTAAWPAPESAKPAEVGDDPFRLAETTRIPKTREIKDGQLDLADDSPYSKQVQPEFSSDAPGNGRFRGEVDEKGRLKSGAEIVDSDGNRIRLGEWPGAADSKKKKAAGGFTDTYPNPDDPSVVVKVRRYKGTSHDKEFLDDMVHDSEVGRKLLVQAQGDDSMFRVAGRKGEPILVRDPNDPDRRFVVTQDQNIASQVNGKTVTNASERFKARGYPATREERLTMQLAVRELNQKGITWVDNKLANLDVVPDASSPTGYRVVFFDYDGFRPTAGKTAALRYRNARQMQQIYDGAAGRADLIRYMGENRTNMNLSFDERAFGKSPPPIATPGANSKRSEYLDLDGMSPAEFKTQVDALARERGKPIPYSPPGGFE